MSVTSQLRRQSSDRKICKAVRLCRDRLDTQIRETIPEYSKLQLVDKCTDGGYELKGRITEVSTDTDHQYRVLYAASRRKMEVEVEAWLLRCGSTAPLQVISEAEKDEDMKEVMEDLAKEVVKELRYDPTVVAQPR